MWVFDAKQNKQMKWSEVFREFWLIVTSKKGKQPTKSVPGWSARRWAWISSIFGDCYTVSSLDRFSFSENILEKQNSDFSLTIFRFRNSGSLDIRNWSCERKPTAFLKHDDCSMHLISDQVSQNQCRSTSVNFCFLSGSSGDKQVSIFWFALFIVFFFVLGKYERGK